MVRIVETAVLRVDSLFKSSERKVLQIKNDPEGYVAEFLAYMVVCYVSVIGFLFMVFIQRSTLDNFHNRLGSSWNIIFILAVLYFTIEFVLKKMIKKNDGLAGIRESYIVRTSREPDYTNGSTLGLFFGPVLVGMAIVLMRVAYLANA